MRRLEGGCREPGTDEGDEQAETDEHTKAFFIRLGDKMIDGLRTTAE